MKIKILSDSTCDLSPEQVAANDIRLFALTVVKNNESFKDNVTITPEDIFSHVANGGDLCSTSAGSLGEYIDLFGEYAQDYDGVLHISLGSGFSSSYQNACLAAAEYDNVRVVDSQNLSTGQGLVVLKACELAKTCNSLDELANAVQEYTTRIEASFLLDQLAYLVKGGRCSALAALGANLLNLKPCIEVKNGKMGVGKKYRGNFAKSLTAYVKDRLSGREDIEEELIFITYTSVSDEVLAAVQDTVKEYGNFRNIVATVAGCTVSCHCGPNTLGVLFVRK